MALYAEAQQMITTVLPVAYMYNNLNAYLMKPRVRESRQPRKTPTGRVAECH